MSKELSMSEGGSKAQDAPADAAAKTGVAEHAERILHESPYHQLHTLKCEFDSGVLTVRGRVSTFYLKQVAQCAIIQLNGVVRIDNRIEVS